jgi:hypothetical protein
MFLALALAACSSPSQSGANADAPAAECNASAVVNGSWGGGGPFNMPPNMFGTVVAVETWDTDASGSLTRHLTIADDTWQLQIDQSSPTVANIQPLFEGDYEPQPPGTGTFTRAGEPCAEGTFEAVFDTGVLSGMYRGRYLGVNPPRP